MALPDLLTFGISCFLFGISLFCANLLVLRGRNGGIYRPLALFCVAEALLQLPEILMMTLGGGAVSPTMLALTAPTLALSMSLAPLFWLYVRRLTAEDDDSAIRYRALHLAPVIAGLAVGLGIALYRHDLMAAQDKGFNEVSIALRLISVAVAALAFLVHLQIAIYMALIYRRISAYRTRLKDLFASTEDRELHWIVWIIAVVGVYLLFGLLALVSDLSGLRLIPLPSRQSETLDQVLGTIVIWIVAVWGLRQKPGLYRAREESLEAPAAEEEEAEGAKYERSALTQEHAQRIAGKIEGAMERDLLYRDPNLSLWGLANHIGVTSNYVSQTLNETLGESFFDYVNKWRVRDAIGQLTTTDQTILAIAYDVGFNSRSPFYKAFKRETGKTPTQLRDEIAAPAAKAAEGARASA